MVKQIVTSEEINKSKSTGLWESQSGIRVVKLTIWVRSLEIENYNRDHQVYQFHQDRLASHHDETPTNTLADKLIKRTSSVLDEKHQKPCIKTKKVITRDKRSTTLNEVKPVKNINKNPQSFLKISPVQKELLPSQKLQQHPYE